MADLLPDPDRYPPARQWFIIEMMQEFELCANVLGSYGQRWLIPELLSRNEPDLKWNPDGALNLEYHYTVLPGGIITRFIVWIQKNQ